MPKVRVTATALTALDKLTEDDQNVPTETVIQVNDHVDHRFLANAALDIFHSHIAIDQLDDFTFETDLLDAGVAKPITQHDDADCYEFSDAGCVFAKSS